MIQKQPAKFYQQVVEAESAEIRKNNQKLGASFKFLIKHKGYFW